VEHECEIVRLKRAEEFSDCATMMLESNPWDRLYFTREQCERDLAKPEMGVYGAISHGRLIGFLASLKNGIGFEPMIEYLCVHQDFRNAGIGTTLISYFEDELFPDADNLYMFVSDINPDAMRLYVRLGYAQVGALPNFNLPTQTEFLHRKSRRARQVRQSAGNIVY
jgi:predicted GNAT family acetyltransferase